MFFSPRAYLLLVAVVVCKMCEVEYRVQFYTELLYVSLNWNAQKAMPIHCNVWVFPDPEISMFIRFCLRSPSSATDNPCGSASHLRQDERRDAGRGRWQTAEYGLYVCGRREPDMPRPPSTLLTCARWQQVTLRLHMCSSCRRRRSFSSRLIKLCGGPRQRKRYS